MLTILLAGATGLALLIWIFAWLRSLQGQPWRYRWSGPGEDTGETLPPVSIIVPARNEADVLPNCLPTILEQNYPEFEVIVVDDQSTDDTKKVLKQFDHGHLTIVDGESRPDSSWQGKPWAAHQGYRKANHDWLLFTDADMEFSPGLLKSIMSEAVDRPDRLHSLLPVTRTGGILEPMLVPLLGLVLSLLYPLHLVNDPNRSEALAAGGFLLFSRTLYDQVGGHREVQTSIAEDRELARRVRDAGNPIWLRTTDNLTTRMYTSELETVEGLTKHLLEGLENRIYLLILLVGMFVYTHLLPLVVLTAGMSLSPWVVWPYAGAMVLAHLLALGVHQQLPHTSLWFLTLLPGLTIYVGLGLMALYQHLVYGGPRWKNRRLKVD